MSGPDRSTHEAKDGNHLALYDWEPAPGAPQRGVVIVVHGLGEHAGRYAQVAEQLSSWGFWVRGYDQFGHGDSGGPRGGLPQDSRLLDDLADMVDAMRQRMAPGVPLVLLGHSLGGLVVARFVALALRPVEGAILSSPALDPGLSRFQKMLLALLPRIAPNLRVGNGLNPAYLSRDPAVVHAYCADRRVHDRISARLAQFIASAGRATLALAGQWSVPTLLMYAGKDRLVDPQGSRDFANAAPQAVLTSVCFVAQFHEIFNEPEAPEVLATMRSWLDQRF